VPLHLFSSCMHSRKAECAPASFSVWVWPRTIFKPWLFACFPFVLEAAEILLFFPRYASRDSFGNALFLCFVTLMRKTLSPVFLLNHVIEIVEVSLLLRSPIQPECGATVPFVCNRFAQIRSAPRFFSALLLFHYTFTLTHSILLSSSPFVFFLCLLVRDQQLQELSAECLRFMRSPTSSLGYSPRWCSSRATLS